ncbi:hypothetical protein Bpfe_017406, partial [Biomphalaria pfeifferi]
EKTQLTIVLDYLLIVSTLFPDFPIVNDGGDDSQDKGPVVTCQAVPVSALQYTFAPKQIYWLMYFSSRAMGSVSPCPLFTHTCSTVDLSLYDVTIQHRLSACESFP